MITSKIRLRDQGNFVIHRGTSENRLNASVLNNVRLRYSIINSRRRLICLLNFKILCTNISNYQHLIKYGVLIFIINFELTSLRVLVLC